MLPAIKLKMDRILRLFKNKNLSTNSNDKYQTIKVGQLTKEEMIRFNLGPYSK
ncbi:hypothetical protein ABE450_001071 [Clostridium perfringens]|uniref:hypothetical protein n=1 Tax=Clostridium perfringens TaxID=1502 RepID=UPI000DF0EA42|nr:hypothetical protein [Clostridium perfringens]EHK2354957.1 hypothetical protein [Clostridium perfringens]ELC8435480.1 hypothetical protein [Clostridium perfringens]MCX0373377.1 hypothetical protein [Clostridium perfringens]MDB2053911.1 hypothetical protein [Clostridium perfringens]MDH2472963.1 hypothetical protein [Clostridium perfringens]